MRIYILIKTFKVIKNQIKYCVFYTFNIHTTYKWRNTEKVAPVFGYCPFGGGGVNAFMDGWLKARFPHQMEIFSYWHIFKTMQTANHLIKKNAKFTNTYIQSKIHLLLLKSAYGNGPALPILVPESLSELSCPQLAFHSFICHISPFGRLWWDQPHPGDEALCLSSHHCGAQEPSVLACDNAQLPLHLWPAS